MTSIVQELIRTSAFLGKEDTTACGLVALMSTAGNAT